MPTVWPPDEEWLLDSAKRTGKVMAVEEHYANAGLGSAISELLSEKCPVPLKRHGAPRACATSGPCADLPTHYKLDAKGISETALEFQNK